MNTEKTIEFYDSHVRAYFDEWKTNDLLLPLLQNLLRRLPGNPAVLDLGCGPGTESKRLVNLGATVTGIDLSTASLDIAREYVPWATFLNMDIRKLDFPEESFDGIVEAAVLFHFTDKELVSIFKNLLRILRPGGAFLSVFMSGTYNGLHEMEVEGKTFVRYLNLKSPEEWTAAVVSAGFEPAEQPSFSEGPFRAAVFTKPAGV